jgi:hypothetical protein
MTPVLRGAIVLVSLAAGFAGGALARRGAGVAARRPADAVTTSAGTPGVREAGSAPPAMTGTASVAKPGSTPAASDRPTLEALAAQARELRSHIAEAAAAEDGRALLGLVRRLARLGEPGFEGAAEALALLVAAANQEPPGLGLEGDELWRLLGNPDLALFEEWVLSDPSRGPSAMRAQVASCYSWQPDVDAARLALARLAVETDPEVLRRLTQALYFTTPEHFAAMADAVRAQAGRPEVATNILMWLGRRGGDKAWPTLQAFVDSPVPEIAEEALIWSLILRPPVAGAVVVGSPKESNVPLKRGDILVSWNGTTVENAAKVNELFEKWQDGSTVNAVVYRGDTLVPVVLEKKPKWLGTRSTTAKK